KFTCGQLGYYRTKPKFESNEIFGGVVPNPSNDVAKLLYSIQSESNCKLEVFNIVGKTIYSNNIDPQNNSVEFTTANWNDGIYSYVISSDDGILLTGKFNVLH
ncbi:MAG: T9SS type A sorting domain-containing protein, partial [Bacteroidia bacterium]|nr:T9SS type A sorting domain-containing protein [Bacteroidia bacterium]